ncbi:hypothetical protein [Candidatus Amarolinea dominans]|uniref:hypothetical protein n=1 Tax=Candidatus Amarolinea dominans TaxID=3140696 RepID=UPI0031CC5CA0
MTSLPAILGTLNAILQADPLCKRVANVETKEFAPDQFLLKIRAELTGKTSLQVRVYYNRGYVDYAYQLFAEIPLLRTDCSILVMAQRLGIPHVFAFDEHIHQMSGLGITPVPGA